MNSIFMFQIGKMKLIILILQQKWIHENYIKTIQKTKLKSRKTNLPIASDSIYLKFKILKQISELLHNSNSFKSNNIDINVIKKFVKEKSFKIMACDKNIGSATISNANYTKISEEHLNDESTYS